MSTPVTPTKIKYRERSADVLATDKRSFTEFGLKESVLNGIVAKGYQFPSPVQCEAIPHLLERKSIMVKAKSGTGKTATYCIPLVNNLSTSLNTEKHKKTHVSTPQAIVIVPVRELALQVSDEIKGISQFMTDDAGKRQVNPLAVFGGMPIRDEIVRLMKHDVHVLIGSTGRLVDLIRNHPEAVSLENVNTVICDECDLLVRDNGKNDSSLDQVTMILEEISKQTKHSVQLEMISATFPMQIDATVRQIYKRFRNMIGGSITRLSVRTDGEDETHILRGVEHKYFTVSEDKKLYALHQIFSKVTFNACIVFVKSADRASALAQLLTEKLGYSGCVFAHGGMSQADRLQVFRAWKDNDELLKGIDISPEKEADRVRILICTDLFARGVDALNCDAAISFDLPFETATYVHRAGRCGRFGQKGLSLVLFDGENDRECNAVENIEDELGFEFERFEFKS